MSRSVQFPLTVNSRGGLALTPEDEPGEPLRQAIAISCIEGDTSHPWHRIAGFASPGGIYRTGNETDTIRMIDRRFEQLAREGRAKLLGRPRVASANGRKVVAFDYLDIERRQAVPMAGGTTP